MSNICQHGVIRTPGRAYCDQPICKCAEVDAMQQICPKCGDTGMIASSPADIEAGHQCDCGQRPVQKFE